MLITVRMTLPIDFEYEWIRQGEEEHHLSTDDASRWHSTRRAAVWRWPWNWHFMIVQPSIMQPTGRAKVSLSCYVANPHADWRLQWCSFLISEREWGVTLQEPLTSVNGRMGLLTNVKSGSAIKPNDSSDSLAE